MDASKVLSRNGPVRLSPRYDGARVLVAASGTMACGGPGGHRLVGPYVEDGRYGYCREHAPVHLAAVMDAIAAYVADRDVKSAVLALSAPYIPEDEYRQDGKSGLKRYAR